MTNQKNSRNIQYTTYTNDFTDGIARTASEVGQDVNKEHVDGSGNVTRYESVIISDRKKKA